MSRFAFIYEDPDYGLDEIAEHEDREPDDYDELEVPEDSYYGA
jgi:hypothetical protein